MSQLWSDKTRRIERERKAAERQKRARGRHRKVQRVRHPIKSAVRSWGF